jgi:hypothetical protein
MGGVVEQGYGLNHMGGVAEMAACTGKQTETLHLQKRKLYDQMFRTIDGANGCSVRFS